MASTNNASKDVKWLIRFSQKISQKPLAVSKIDYTPYQYIPSHIEYQPVKKEYLSTSPLGELTVKGHTAFVYLASYENEKQFKSAVDNPKKSGRKVHFTYCKTLKDEARDLMLGRFYSSNRKDGLFTIELSERDKDSYTNPTKKEVALAPCQHCIEYLYNLRGDEHELRQSLADEFSFAQFSERKQGLALPTWRTVMDEVTGEKEWNQLSRALRKEHDYTCEMCGFQAKNNYQEQFIHTHHKDGNKKNNHRDNLCVICYRCHASMPQHRLMKLGDAKALYEEFDIIHRQYFLNI